MKSITVYDPPMCCKTGVCGPSVDPKIVQFAGDLEWLKTRGVDVQRYNLAQEPERFVANSAVKAILERSGDEELPAILAGEAVLSSGRFPSRDELAEMAGLEISAADAKTGNSGTGCGCGASKTGCC